MEYKFSSLYLREELGIFHKASKSLQKAQDRNISDISGILDTINSLFPDVVTPKSKRKEIFIRKLIVKIYKQKIDLKFRADQIYSLFSEKRILLEKTKGLEEEIKRLQTKVSRLHKQFELDKSATL
ncbi:hypothetical protein [Leptospira sp. id769339]|uniref:hypothetical protein n=1 Tax=Leptospira sp. id769339 TaxID=2864221 RepID=UPI00214B9616|nr:hypothetical protein [Leptospira sp. id769339]MCR1794873.1 hypothetical protein [Leptospira sp. id769339]